MVPDIRKQKDTAKERKTKRFRNRMWWYFTKLRQIGWKIGLEGWKITHKSALFCEKWTGSGGMSPFHLTMDCVKLRYKDHAGALVSQEKGRCTMNRVLELENAMLEVIREQEGRVAQRDESLSWEVLHMASCARLAWEMAEERDVDPELASCAAAVHDFGRILTGKQEGHAEAGYGPVKEFLKATRLFEDWQVEQIAEAVRHHSEKAVKGTPLEEIVKDADVVDCHQYGVPGALDKPERKKRYDSWANRHSLFF